MKLELSNYKAKLRAAEESSLNSASSMSSTNSTLASSANLNSGQGSHGGRSRLNVPSSSIGSSTTITSNIYPNDADIMMNSLQINNGSLSRIPSKLRTKKSPKTPGASSSSVFSPESSKSSAAPTKTPTLTEKQEQILKNAMELYGHKPAAKPSQKTSTSSSGWGFLG